MLDICDTEGNLQNGGGSFTVQSSENGKFAKFEPDHPSPMSGHRGSIIPGDIGSPVPGTSVPVAGTLGGIGSSSVLGRFTSPTGF